MLDKNMDWNTLRGKDGKWTAFHTMAEACMKIHRDGALPCYEHSVSVCPPDGLFTTPDKMEGALGYMDTQQLMKVGEYDNDTPQAAWVREQHSLDYAYVKTHTQPCGMMVKNHRDVNGSLMRSYPGQFGTREVIKVLHFLSDWQQGQVVMLGDQSVTAWRSGDSLTFPWYMEHATANCNQTHERHMLFISGIRKYTPSA
jgi:hypothetical protein